jgi:uncharacterized SAM-binding protein YcdF (DUF218 family)
MEAGREGARPAGAAMPHSVDMQGLMTEHDPSSGKAGQSGAEPDRANAGAGLRRLTGLRWSPARLALAGLVVLVVAFSIGFVFFCDRVGRMNPPTQVEAADAIVVLTGGYQRVVTALDLLKMKRGKRLLISGVHPSINRAELSHATQADPGLFRCCVDLDHAARDTISNATESAKWIKANGFHSIILVTNNYHIPRSLLEMRRAAAGVTFVPYPVVAADLDDNRWLSRPRALRVLLIEYVKYVAAVVRGALPPVMMTASARAWEWASAHG